MMRHSFGTGEIEKPSAKHRFRSRSVERQASVATGEDCIFSDSRSLARLGHQQLRASQPW